MAWKRNMGTKFEMRWDNGTDEVHIHKVAQMSHPRRGKTQYRYFVEGSGATGGFFSIGHSEHKGEAMKIARTWMKEQPSGW